MTESFAIEDWLYGFVMERSFLHKYPHYAYILAQMIPFDDPTIEVMAVSYQRGKLFLHVNAAYFMQHPQFIRGVLLHEVHHVVLGHLTRFDLRDVAHPRLMEIAMEISANEYIDELLPDDPITLEMYLDVGILPGQSTRERYEILRTAMERGERLLGRKERMVDQHHAWGVGFPDPSTEGHKKTPLQRSEQPIQQVIRSGIARGEQLAHEIKRPWIRMAGRDPVDLLEELDLEYGEPVAKMDWRAALQMFVGRMRSPRHTYARPNRRFPHKVGVVPGRIYAPGNQAKPSLLVAIDTSASVTRDELLEIARHLQLLRSLVEITIVECDLAIQRVYAFSGVLKSVKGRGGTDLRPVFAPEILNKYQPDGVIYFTDGEGPYPSTPPPIPTLWVLTWNEPFDCPWGEIAHLKLPDSFWG